MIVDDQHRVGHRQIVAQVLRKNLPDFRDLSRLQGCP
jgi:hypothetical protein